MGLEEGCVCCPYLDSVIDLHSKREQQTCVSAFSAPGLPL